MKTARGLRRAGVGVVDQGLYSLTNFALTVLVARSVSAAEFGAYSLILVTYIIGIAAVRGLTCETFMVRYSRGDTREWSLGAQAAAGAALVAGGLFGAALVGVGFVLGGTLGRTAWVFGALVPGLFLQDFLRYAALAHGRPRLALWNDGTTAAIQFSLVGFLLSAGAASVPALVAAWGLGAHGGAVVAAWHLGVRPQVHRAMEWFRRHKDLAFRYFTANLVGQGGAHGNSYVVAGVAGLGETGALRGAQTVFGPPAIANLGIKTAVTPELVRVLGRSPLLMRHYTNVLGAGLAGFGLLWGIAAIMLPDRIGVALLGDTWRLTEPLLVFLAVAQVANGWRVGPMAGLLALGDGRRTLRARVVITALGFVFTVTGAALGGARGVAIALAVVSPLQAMVWWWECRRALADRMRQPVGEV